MDNENYILISSDEEDIDEDNVSCISTDSDYFSSDIDNEIDEVNFQPEDDFFGAWAGEIMANSVPLVQPQLATTPPTSPFQPLGRLRVRSYDTAFPPTATSTPTARALDFLNGQPPSARRAIDFNDGPSTSGGVTQATRAALAFLQPPALIRQNAMPLAPQPSSSRGGQNLRSRLAAQPMIDGGNLRHKPSVPMDNIYTGLTCGNIIPFFGRAANKTTGPIPSRPQNYDVAIPTPRFPFPSLSYSTPPLAWNCSICLEDRRDLAIILHTCDHHYFHLRCILPVYGTNDWRCPLCRRE